MRKCSSKIASLFLALVMLVSLVAVPATAQASELNEITGFIWDVNSITGIKFADSYADSTNMQVMLAVYNGTELESVVSKDVAANENTVYFDAPITLVTGQSAKAFLWNSQGIEPLAKSLPVKRIFPACISWRAESLVFCSKR